MRNTIYDTLLTEEWVDEFTLEFFTSDYFKKLGIFLNREYSSNTCFPKRENIFKIFKEISPKDVRVVILSQDPYSHKDEATGIAFGVDTESVTYIPPSLKIIEAEVRESLHYPDNWTLDYSLMSWVKQGVFLLNTSLTVRESEPGSHSHMWNTFTKATISTLNKTPGKIFLLWGKYAQGYKSLINEKQHYILEAAHPASEAYKRGAGFFDCNHFEKVNDIIKMNNGDKFIIQW